MPLRSQQSLVRLHTLLFITVLIFTVSPLHAQTATTLYTFTGGLDGKYPQAALIRDSAGNLYGTTTAAGYYTIGTAFKIDSSDNFSVLDAFGGAADGVPTGGLVMDSQGNLYGATWNGGTAGLGTIYKIDTANNLTVLYNFDNSKGSNPYAPLSIDSSGNLYGTAYTGGAGGYGTVFKLDTSNNLTVLYSFTGNYDGGYPYSGLVMDSSGNLYGTTYLGGGLGAGTVYEIATSNNFSVLYTFLNGSDGANPKAGLAIDASGNLYGTASEGGWDTGRSSSSALPLDSLSCTASPVELMARHPTRLPSSMPTEIFMAPRILAVPVLRERSTDSTRRSLTPWYITSPPVRAAIPADSSSMLPAISTA